MRRGDLLEEEFEKLFKDNYSDLFYRAYGIVEDREVSRDIVSDVFADAWKQYARLRQEAIVSYLHRAVQNRSIDWLRHEEVVKNYQQAYCEFVRHWAAAEEALPEEDIILAKQLLNTFPQQTRFIFEQCCLEGKKYREVARIMGLSEAAIHKHMVKALSILRNGFAIKNKNKK